MILECTKYLNKTVIPLTSLSNQHEIKTNFEFLVISLIIRKQKSYFRGSKSRNVIPVLNERFSFQALFRKTTIIVLRKDFITSIYYKPRIHLRNISLRCNNSKKHLKRKFFNSRDSLILTHHEERYMTQNHNNSE